ncbi:MAG: YCF48-related protein [Pseudomonas sp.]
MALGLSSVLLAGSSSALAQSTESLKPAIVSLKASKTLLLDVAQAGDRLVAVGARGHIVYSDDNGASWLQAAVPVRQLLTAVYFVDDTRGWAVGHDSLILHTQDAGTSWTVQYRDPELDTMDDEGFGFLEKPLMDVWFRDARNGFAAGAYGLLVRTTDGGQTWEDVSFDVDNEDGFHYNAITEVKDTGLFMVGEMGTMYRSADYGDTWETIEEMPYDGSWFGVSGTGEAGGVIAWGLRGNVFRSEDFGDSWQEVTLMSPNNGPLRATLAGGGLTADGRLIIVGVGGVVAISKDGGRSFDVTVRTDRVSLAAATALENDRILLVGQRGAVNAAADGSVIAGNSAVTVPEIATEK